MNNNRKKISVLIIAYNEEKNIRECLESVKWADEIILVDAESKDSTVDIAKNYTDKIYIRKWQGYFQQRMFSLQQATNEWILSLDADERVSNELRYEIESILSNEVDVNGFYIPRRNHFLGKVIKSCFWYPDYQLKLFRKQFATVTNRKVHEAFEVFGKKSYLRNDIIHLTHQNLKDTFRKINEYSTLQAEEKIKEKKVKPYDLILHPISAFLNHFISRKGYKDGIYGLMVSLVHMITNMMTYMKIWELQNAEYKEN
ncbi:MAG: glycosyltransferase family 2 protein [Melioribacter sp.]|nr:glycosyltransferase family 2 protein [Melioribacter sp.]